MTWFGKYFLADPLTLPGAALQTLSSFSYSFPLPLLLPKYLSDPGLFYKHLFYSVREALFFTGLNLGIAQID